MAEPAPIPAMAEADDPGGFDFRSLYDDGLRHVQALCGDNWTDYNDHDPGVTILQQACYALTEVAYRIDFPIADIIAERSPRAGAQALYPGDRSLTCDPVTIEDLRKLAYDTVHNLRNVWIEEVERDKPRGLFRAYVEPYHYAFDPATPQTSDPRPALALRLAQNRPLCTDIVEIVLLRRVAILVAANLVIDTGSAADDIVASIVAALQTSMVPYPTIVTVDELFADGVPPDIVFDGPRLGIGTIATQVDRPRHIAIDDIEQIIRRQTGVIAVDQLAITVDGRPCQGRTIDLGPQGIPGLDVDGTIAALKPSRGGIPQALDPKRIVTSARYFQTIQAWDDSDGSRTLELDLYKAVPFGRHRDLSDVTPIRMHLPMVYGVGPDGLPARDSLGWIPTISDARRAIQATRLKTYLHAFDQIAANVLAQLDHAAELFALERPPGAATYFALPVAYDASEDDASRWSTILTETIETLDPARPRREAMLDHLLARFDQRFDDSVWDRRDPPDVTTTMDANRDRRIRQKERFLQSMLDLSGKRGTGVDLSIGRQARCALAQRLSCLTGIDDVRVIEHILLRELFGDARGEQALSFYEHRVSIIMPDATDLAGTGLKHSVERIVLENCPVHIEGRVLWLPPDERTSVTALLDAWHDARQAALLDPRETAPADHAARDLRARLAAHWARAARPEAGDER